MKLSAKQREVIKRLRGGDLIHYMDGLNARCFWYSNFKNVHWNTIFYLERHGLTHRGDRFVTLTELGKTIEL